MPQIPDHPSRIVIYGGSKSGKTNSSFNLINRQSDIDHIYFSTEDPYKAKCPYVVKKPEYVGTKYLMVLKLLLNTQMIW